MPSQVILLVDVDQCLPLRLLAAPASRLTPSKSGLQSAAASSTASGSGISCEALLEQVSWFKRFLLRLLCSHCSLHGVQGGSKDVARFSLKCYSSTG